MKLSYYINSLVNRRWALGIVKGGMKSVFEDNQLKVDWIKMPKDRWFADPFILDVTNTEIILLVEDFAYKTKKGVISLLRIDKKSFHIVSRKVLLELDTHLSFPIILRKNGHIYVYPESRNSGRLDMYEFDVQHELLHFVATICDDEIWDSAIVDFWEEPLLFTTAKDNFQLDIYKWNNDINRFTPYQVIPSTTPNSRLGGAPFAYNGKLYYPAQDCSSEYGGALDIKRIDRKNDKFIFTTIKHISSPHPKYPLGLHTLNEFKGVVVIDVNGWRYGKLSAFLHSIIEFLRHINEHD